jgi:hypothetical protein
LGATTKRRVAERVRRALTKRLRQRGFTRGKTTFWSRPKVHVIEFVHLHLFTFAPTFRAHCGIRVLNDTFDAAALNGPDSDSIWSDDRRTYVLDFADDHESVTLCVDALDRFCVQVAEPWFERYTDPRTLLASESPLIERERLNLERSVRGKSNPTVVRFSKELLGVA